MLHESSSHVDTRTRRGGRAHHWRRRVVVALTATCVTALSLVGMATPASAGTITSVSFVPNTFVSATPAAVWTIGFTTSSSGALVAGKTVVVRFPTGFNVAGATGAFGTGFSGTCTTPTPVFVSTISSEYIFLPLPTGCTLGNSTAATVTLTGISSPFDAYTKSAFGVQTYPDATFSSPSIDSGNLIGAGPFNILASTTYSTQTSGLVPITSSTSPLVDPSSPYAPTFPTITTVLGNTGGFALTGFTFAGWCTTTGAPSPTQCTGTNYAPGDPLLLTANTTLYSQWIALPSTFTVTYNLNGLPGVTPVDPSSPYLSGATVTVLSGTGVNCAPGTVFTGWNTAANGTGTNYSAGSTIPAILANATLYARPCTPLPYSGPASKLVAPFDLQGPTTATVGQALTYTATLPTQASGTVTVESDSWVIDGQKFVKTLDTHSLGKASFTVIFDQPGQHVIAARYSGDANYLPDTRSLNVFVKQPTSVFMTLAENPTPRGNSVNVMAVVTGSRPGGNVTFRASDGAVWGLARVDAFGIAKTSLVTLAAGRFPITATYEGDDFNADSTSAAVVWLVAEPQEGGGGSGGPSSRDDERAPVFTSKASGKAVQGKPVKRVTITAEGVPTPSIRVKGRLPKGLKFSDRGYGTARLTGRPSSSGNRTITFVASSSAGSAEQSFTLKVVRGDG